MYIFLDKYVYYVYQKLDLNHAYFKSLGQIFDGQEDVIFIYQKQSNI